jgi:hypothetical protein
MPMTFRDAAVLSFALALSVSVDAQTPRKDGNWEVTMQVEIPAQALSASIEQER